MAEHRSTTGHGPAALDEAALQDFLAREFPQMDYLNFQIEEVRSRYLRGRTMQDERHLRPGGTIAGPTMMAMADCAMWLAIIGTLGRAGEAVTTNLNMNFLRRPAPGDLVAETRILKLGRRLAVGEVFIHSGDQDEPVAHATLTYALPDQK